jgi:hypothetical protein
VTPDGDYLPIAPGTLEVWASQEATPLYPGAANFNLDWLTEGPLVRIFNSGSQNLRIPLPANYLVRHVMVRIKEMTDEGRAKVNEFIVWRRNLDGAPNDEEGAGQVVRDLLELLLEEDEISIEADAFLGTSLDLSIPESTLADVLATIGEECAAYFDYTKDGQIEVSRSPFHPLGTRPEIIAQLDAAMIRSPHEATRPSRLGLSQVIVESIGPNGERVEGRYPPVPGLFGNVERVQARFLAGNSQAAAEYAEMLYKANPKISGTFNFQSSGPMEWLDAGHRVLMYDYSDAADPTGRLVNSIVQGVKHNDANGAETVELQEWRMA